MKDYPKNKEEYWKNVEAHWADLINIVAAFSCTNVKAAEQARLSQDPKIADIFNQAWENAPDNPHIHYIPGWNALCDLCSESYVLFDEEGNPL